MMAKTNPNLTKAVESFFVDLERARATGGVTGELSAYGPLENFLNAVGGALKPRVFCVGGLKNQGAGHPDFGLYRAGQRQRSGLQEGQVPEHGVVEVKAPHEDTRAPGVRTQVSRYWDQYRLVLVTNLREFTLIGPDEAGGETELESFKLADSEAEFAERLERPKAFAREVGLRLGEYLCRALSHRATITEPKDLAWLLASYARDGLTRVEVAGETPSLGSVRTALEEALGVRFKGEKGVRFFHSTLVQTLFYGVFSAWVLWARTSPPPDGAFRWREAVWHLRAPVLRSLFLQLSDPGQLEPLGLVEVLNWTATALDRVERETFFARFNEGEAVPYFYEPFLEAFDPELRKQLGVWYTPVEIVRYMVARVDKALKDKLGIADGLAAENVYVLDPCCGTGAYLSEVLRRIASNLKGRGLGALEGEEVKKAATERVFGFEIMPAPFVVAHLQVGLTMEDLDAPFADDRIERAGIYLTNALTGWEPRATKPLPFPELEEERDRAERVKQERPILVILGNPPYDGYAAMAVGEERELSEAYRTSTERVRRPEGPGLNDPFVRFFRMAERRIAEKTGQGVVCFISNYSWLDGLSFPGMRERYLEAFDSIYVDNLHGDRIISEYAPDGQSSETVFAVRGKSPGIRVGTSIALLTKNRPRTKEQGRQQVLYRDFHQARAGARRDALLASLEACDIDQGYLRLEPDSRLGLPFKPAPADTRWFDWPKLLDLFPTSFPGVKTSRDGFLVDSERGRLEERVGHYFDPEWGDEDIARCYPSVMRVTGRFDAPAVRRTLLARGGPHEDGFLRIAYRPFDNRWLFWEKNTKLLDEKRADYKAQVLGRNPWLVFQNKARPDLSPPLVISCIGDLNQMNSGVYCVPAYLWSQEVRAEGAAAQQIPNLSPTGQAYLERIGANVLDLIHHIVAVLHSVTYNKRNADVLRADGPRIPLPGWPTGSVEGAAEELVVSAKRGYRLAALLDPDTPVLGVTEGALRAEMTPIAVPATVNGGNMTADERAVTAGWGYIKSGDVVMPRPGRDDPREYTSSERSALGDSIGTLGETTVDVYLNDRAYWRNVPAAVWEYKLGGYQILKKWLSYRERSVLGRPLLPDEVRHFTDTARRIAGILLEVSTLETGEG